jgi:hypothetical protein
MGGAGERGEDLLAVDLPAAVRAGRGRAERRLAGGRGASLREGLGVDRTFLHHAREVQPAMTLVLRALLRGHLQVVGEQARPQRGAGVHVEGERGGAAVLAERRRNERIGLEIRAFAAVLRRHA